jgi:hypothetical protein
MLRALTGGSLVLAVAVALSACSDSRHAPKSAGTAGDAAQNLLRSIGLPPGARPVLDSAAGVPAQLLTGPSERLVRGTDRHGLWLSDVAPAQLLGYVSARAPRGSSKLESGSTGTNGRETYWWLALSVPGRASFFERLEIKVALRPGGGEFVRVDAVVAPRPERPRDSFVPLAASRLTATVLRRDGSVRQAVHVDNPQQVRSIAAAVNALPAVQASPGARLSCPYGAGTVYVLLRFQANSSATVAESKVEPYECGNPSVWITVPPGHPVGLKGAIELLHDVQDAGRIHLTGLPSSGSTG